MKLPHGIPKRRTGRKPRQLLLTELRKAIARGDRADFDESPWKDLAPTMVLAPDGRKRPWIKAEVVRELVLHGHAPSGVQILNVVVKGNLDLRNARAPAGGASNTLKLEACVLIGDGLEWDDPRKRPAFDACHSHMSRLSLIECKITEIHISSAVLEGDLILDGILPLAEDGECWVRARGIRVGGSVTASRAQLRAPKECAPYWSDRSSRYALDLHQARIGGSLELRRGFTADGGLTMDRATIGGDLMADGATLQAVVHENPNHKDVCLRAQGAQIQGAVYLNCHPVTNKPFKAQGRLDFGYTRIGGGVVLMGARLCRRNATETQESSLNLIGATFGGLWLGRSGVRHFAASDTVSIVGSNVIGPVFVEGMRRLKQRRAAVGPEADPTDSDPEQDGWRPRGEGEAEARWPRWPRLVVDMTDATVQGSFSVESISELIAIQTTFGISVDLRNVDGSVKLGGSRIATGLVAEDVNVMDVTDATIRGSVYVSRVSAFTARDTSFGVSLALTHVGGVILDGSQVTTDLTIMGTLAGSADLSGIAVAGDLVLGNDRVALTFASVVGSEVKFDLKDARIGGCFRVERIELSRQVIEVVNPERVDVRVVPPGHDPNVPPRLRTADLGAYADEWVLAEALFEFKNVEPETGRPETGGPGTPGTDTGSSAAVLAFLYRRSDPTVVVLDGQSSRIHDLNAALGLRLTDRMKVEEYLSLFCNNVWGDEGPFRIVPPAANSEGKPLWVSNAPDRDGGWSATATVAYGSDLFEATFLIEPSGSVNMIDDRPLGAAPVEKRPIRYEAPYRWAGPTFSPSEATSSDMPWPVDVPFGIDLKEVEAPERDEIWDALLAPENGNGSHGDPETGLKLAVDLTRAKVRALMDSGGNAWLALDPYEHTTDRGRVTRTPWPSRIRRFLRLDSAKAPRRSPVTLILNGLEYDWEDVASAKQDFALVAARDLTRVDPPTRRRPSRSIYWLTNLRRALTNLPDRLSGATRPRGPAPFARQRLADRRAWLDLQYEDPEIVVEKDYKPQPFEQLAKVWRAEGDYSHASEITFTKLALERKVFGGRVFDGGLGFLSALAFVVSAVLLAAMLLGFIPGDAFGSIIVVAFIACGLLLVPKSFLKLALLEWPFGYGLKTERALLTFALVWLVGGVLVWAGSDGTAVWASEDVSGRAVMKVDTSAVSTVASATAPGGTAASGSTTAPGLVVQVVDVKGDREIPCLNQIDPFVYALDVMVPLLDLRQEQRCAVSADGGSWFWRLVKVFFAVAGWVVVSGIVLTASGVVRRHVEH